MEKELQELLKLEFLNEDVQKSLAEAFTKKIDEAKQQAREEVTRELTEQYSRRYAEAKAELVEATDKMVTTAVTKYLEEKQAEVVALKEERKKLSEALKTQRAEYKARVTDHTKMLETFILKTVKKEVEELNHGLMVVARERVVLNKAIAEQEEVYAKKIAEHTALLNSFIANNLKKEISELSEDHKALLATKVELEETIAATKIESQNKLNESIAAMKASVMAELQAEKARLDAERNALAEKRVEAVKSLKEHREELNRLYADRLKKLEGFIVEQVTKEMTEFEADKAKLNEERVRLHAEAKEKLAETQKQFIARASKMVQETINAQLTKEFTVLKEDIEEARKNNFGRKLFEAYAMEFMSSFYSESSEVKKVQAQLNESQNKLTRVMEQAEKQQKLLEAASRKAKLAEEKATRTKVLSDLLSTLDKSKRSIMEGFLATVKTENLKESYNRYLPAVLNGVEPKKTVAAAPVRPAAVLNESNTAVVAEKKNVVEVTGNRENNRFAESVKTEEAQSNTAEIFDLRRLAGIK
jgi:hypothetical protein